MGVVSKLRKNNTDHLIASTCFATCDTAAATAAKVATIQDSQAFSLATGMTVHVKFTNFNTASKPTLNINSTGAKSIKTCSDSPYVPTWLAGSVVSFTYSDNNWYMDDYNYDYRLPIAMTSDKGKILSVDVTNSVASYQLTNTIDIGRKSNTTVGNGSTAEGYTTTASASYSHAEGYTTTASGSYSHAEGNSTVAQRKAQHVFGEFNIADTGGTNGTTRGDYVEIVGNGTAYNSHSNARTLDWSGNEWLAGYINPQDGMLVNFDEGLYFSTANIGSSSWKSNVGSTTLTKVGGTYEATKGQKVVCSSSNGAYYRFSIPNSYILFGIKCKIDTSFSQATTNQWYNQSCILGCEMSGQQKDCAIIIDKNGYFALGYDMDTIASSDVNAKDGNAHTLFLYPEQGYINLFIDGTLKVRVLSTMSGQQMRELGVFWNNNNYNISKVYGEIYSVGYWTPKNLYSYNIPTI